MFYCKIFTNKIEFVKNDIVQNIKNLGKINE